MGQGKKGSTESIFYFDGDCGLCVTTVRSLSRLDWLRQVTWTPYQTLEEPPEDLAWHDLDRSAYLVAGRRGPFKGYFAFRMLALRLAALMPLAPLLWFPGVRLVGVRIYRWVADHRYRLSGCRALEAKTDRQRL